MLESLSQRLIIFVMTKYAIGLIGGIASGKSQASQYFRELGISVIDADEIAHDIVKRGRPLLVKISEYFGPSILNAEGELNRTRLRELIFANPKERLWLENTMHPIIRQKIDAAIDAALDPYCVVAIPLLKQREDYPKLKKIVMLDAPYEMQIQRLMERDHITEELAAKMIASQHSREERLKLADMVLINDQKPRHLKEQILALHQSILEGVK